MGRGVKSLIRVLVLMAAFGLYQSSTVSAKKVTCDEIDEFFCGGAIATALAYCNNPSQGRCGMWENSVWCDPFQEGGCSMEFDCVICPEG